MSKKTEESKNGRRERFLRVGAHRANEVIRRMQLLKLCGNRTGYEYTDTEVEQLMGALEKEMADIRTAFLPKERPKQDKFAFETTA